MSGDRLDCSCRLFNNAPYDGYRVTLFGAGRLEVALSSPNFSGLVTLRGDDGRALASDAAAISVTVPGGGDYTVLAAGADASSRGDYSLVLKFAPSDDETCRPLKTLRSSEDVKGSIDDGSCRFGADSLFTYYDLIVSEAGFADLGVVPSGEMSTLVAVLDRSGRLVSEDLQSGGLNKPILGQQLAPGAYTALIITQSKGGDYTLRYRFTPGPPAICPALELKPGAASGSLAGASSCHFVSGLQDVYTFVTPAAGTLDIALSSDDFYGTILLRDAKDNTLVRSDASDLQDARIVADVAAGAYSLSTLSIYPGAYSLNYKFTPHDPPACPGARNLGLNSGLSATLGDGACRGSDGQPVDSYQFTIPSAGMVALFMTSSEGDSYLTLTDSQGSILRRDDDSYGAPDAMILQWLPGGTYRVNASASGGPQAGGYRLDALFIASDRPPGCLPIGDLSPGTIQGSLHVTSCNYRDDTFADIYRVTAAEAADLDITMSADGFDAYLELLDERGNVIDVDDNSGGRASARLATSVDAGVYYVVATPFENQGYAVGQYSLVIK